MRRPSARLHKSSYVKSGTSPAGKDRHFGADDTTPWPTASSLVERRNMSNRRSSPLVPTSLGERSERNRNCRRTLEGGTPSGRVVQMLLIGVAESAVSADEAVSCKKPTEPLRRCGRDGRKYNAPNEFFVLRNTPHSYDTSGWPTRTRPATVVRRGLIDQTPPKVVNFEDHHSRIASFVDSRRIATEPYRVGARRNDDGF